MKKIKVANGIFWVEIVEKDLRILCGSPMDSIKHLKNKGLINNIEIQGRMYESGPNAILLSDVSMQKRTFSNLAEFPVLHMIFKQYHGEKKRKPLLIGNKQQITAQRNYIYRGTYGLVTKKELMDAGATEKEALSMLRMKRQFAGGDIPKPGELLDVCILESERQVIDGDLIISRIGVNKFEFTYGDESIIVDLNLQEGEVYQAPYKLDFHHISREYFSIIHIGEGNGWDCYRPCMSSILCFQGGYYLIDAGPNIQHSLTAMGISINEIEGIFHTHAHDDHFAGLTALLECDHTIKYYATPLVRNSVLKKLTSLLGMDEQLFNKSFEFIDLTCDVWNNIKGLEVMPVFSPHPVETSVFYFRVFWDKGYKSYAHLADIPSLEILKGMVNEDLSKPGITQFFYNVTEEMVLRPVDIKKIDVGGGMIHGDAKDFIGDKSGKIILSHTSEGLSDAQKEIGSNAGFGMQDIIISAGINFDQLLTSRYLRDYFPSLPDNEIQVFMNCPMEPVNVGAIIMRKNEVPQNVFLILSGEAEYIDTDLNVHNRVSAGSLVGEIECLFDIKSRGTTRAVSYLNVLRIHTDLYKQIIERNEIKKSRMIYHDKRIFLKNSALFGDSVSSTVQSRIAPDMEIITLDKGEIILLKEPGLYLIQTGWVKLYFKDKMIETLERGNFFGEDTLLIDSPSLFSAKTGEPSSLYFIPSKALLTVPIIYWKIMETYERRIRVFASEFPFIWRPEFNTGLKEIDEEHMKIFKLITDIESFGEEKNIKVKGVLSELKSVFISHFMKENQMMSSNVYCDIERHKEHHKQIQSTISNLVDSEGFVKFLALNHFKEYFLREILDDDRRMMVCSDKNKG